MRIVVAPDSYKGSLSAAEVAIHMEEGIREVVPDAEVVKIPMADGGEGTVDAIISATGGQLHAVEVIGPLGDPVTAVYGVTGDGMTAVIEMAAASGIMLVPREKLNPLEATTYGTGQLIRAALDRGCRSIIIGIGGSATNDGGAGMAQALGVRLLDAEGADIAYGGGRLSAISRIDISGLDPRIAECAIKIACDVTNPLCGPEGASAVFGPQKGATEQMIRLLDEGLRHYSKLIYDQLGIDVGEARGAGAAGGLGAGMIAFLSAHMVSGIELVLEATGFENQVRQAQLVFTGEGRTDAQTVYGKTPAGVAAAAKKYNKPVICLSGGVSFDTGRLHEIGIDVVVGATQAPVPLEDAIRCSPSWIRQAIANVMRIFLLQAKYR